MQIPEIPMIRFVENEKGVASNSQRCPNETRSGTKRTI